MSNGLRDKSCLVIDHGVFLCLALRLAEQDGFGTVYYWCPWETAFSKMDDWAVGQGFDQIIRVDDWADVIDEVDVVVFPDVHRGGTQEWLEKKGYKVWGSRKIDQFELNKLKFKKLQKQLGMNVGKYDTVIGVEALRDYCKRHKNKWVKLIKQFRGNRETFYHGTYEESRQTIDEMAVEFGGLQDHVGFILEEPLESKDPDEVPLEGGIDTYVIDGDQPDHVVFGWEVKDKCYLATVKPYDEVPEEFRAIHEPMLPLLKAAHYRNWFSDEIRHVNGKSIMLEPTHRQASPAGEEQLKMYANIPQIIYEGAHGRLVQPEVVKKCACEAIIEHKSESKGWKSLRVPSEVEEWVMLYACAKDGDMYHVKPGITCIGAVVGIGDTPKEAIEHLKSNANLLDSKQVSVNVESLSEAIQEIQAAEEQGIEFSDGLPEPAEVIENSD